MKIKLTEIFNGGGSYVTPSVKVLEIASEGLLCGSYTWTEGGAGTYEFINDNGEY